jgi:translation initiation factor eIF-2B subunit beta
MIEAISEIINEIETSVQNIASQSLDHIHANEIILAMGKSQTVEAFLKVWTNNDCIIAYNYTFRHFF